MAPGDPVSITEISKEGQAQKQAGSEAFGSDDRYLQFREFYGLTLPILFNTWPNLSQEQVLTQLTQLVTRKETPTSTVEMPTKDYDAIRIKTGDQARFVMPILLSIMQNKSIDLQVRKMAMRFFIRGGYRQAYLGPNITEEQKVFNNKSAKDNQFLRENTPLKTDNEAAFAKKLETLTKWYDQNLNYFDFKMNTKQKISIFFFDTRFFKYMSRVLTLDFGTLRNDSNKTVISEVTKRFKYSLTLALIPMLVTFIGCLFFGFIMALQQNRWPDWTLNLIFLVLYAIPVFVVAPFLIEAVALNGHFPFTNIPIPYSGFTSPDSIYDNMTSQQRLFDIMEHIALPLVAIMYGSLAAQARLSRTAVLEVMRQDYVRTAKAKGLTPWEIWYKHIGRNASITIVTSIAGSLGIVLGGSLIVETLFEIDGFGRFFYQAVVNRDYNVIMFSAFAGSFLTLLGYLVADIAYTILDPRVTLD
jgi:peptide/nickel transport system permease protein